MSAAGDAPEITSRKRKLEDDESGEENEAKRKLVTPDDSQQSGIEIQDLVDEVLMEILLKLDGESLHALGSTCMLFKRLCLEKKLWNNAVFTSKELDIFQIFKRLKHLTVASKTLRLQGNCKRDNIDQRPMPNRQTFKEIIKRIVERSPLLQHLHFTKICFDWTKDFSIALFPANLKTLSFTNCIMPKSRNRRNNRNFSGIVEHMPQLEELRLEHCNFFESNDIMPFSKLQQLKTLSLRGCGKMRNCVPYLSLACRFGFPKLEILDLRETNVSDGELQCLNAIKSLRQLFLEHPEMEPWNDDSDDDDFELFVRGPRRPTGQPEPVLPPQNQPEPGPSQRPAESPASPQPSTSRASDEPVAPPAPVVNDENPPSSPESFSDSVSSSTSGPEDSPMRTIVIRANINADAFPEQRNEPRIQVIFGGDVPHARRFLHIGVGRNREILNTLSVSDRGMLGFGFPRSNLMGNLVFIGNQPNDPNTYLERIILRNFRNITDTTLTHFETNAPRLAFLDIRGCPQITREAVERFKVARTECELISNYDNEE